MTSKAVVSSVTRRSAGLPLVIQSIVVSESKAKQVWFDCLFIATLLLAVSCPDTNIGADIFWASWMIVCAILYLLVMVKCKTPENCQDLG